MLYNVEKRHPSNHPFCSFSGCQPQPTAIFNAVGQVSEYMLLESTGMKLLS